MSRLVDAKNGIQLDRQAIRQQVGFLARQLRTQLGSEPGNGRILLLVDLSSCSLLRYLACMAAGYTAVPVDPQDYQRQATAILGKIKPRLVWGGTAKHLDVLGGAGEVWGSADAVMAAEARDESNAKQAEQSQPEQALPDDSALPDWPCLGTAALMMTSGSTGSPDFVQVSQENLRANTVDIVRSQGLSAEDSVLAVLPLSYCFGTSLVHSHFWAGGSVVLDSRLMFAEKVLDTLVGQACTSFAGVPTVYHFLLQHSSLLERDLPSLRRWLQAGGPLDWASIHRVRNRHAKSKFFVMYGQTEATARISTFAVESECLPTGCVGFPLASLEVKLEAHIEAPAPDAGELWVRGPSICERYLENPLRSAEKFQQGWLRTGDLARLDEQGRICILGRVGGFAKIRGRRIGLARVQDLLRPLEGVEDVACVALAHEMTGEALGLQIEGSGGSELEARVRQALPADWEVAIVRFGPIPRTSSGKPAMARLKTALQQELARV